MQINSKFKIRYVLSYTYSQLHTYVFNVRSSKINIYIHIYFFSFFLTYLPVK